MSLMNLRTALDQRRISSVELAQHYLQRIEEMQAQQHDLNAFVHVDAALTLTDARLADQRLAQGERCALLGIPIAHKDIFVTQKWRSTACSKMLHNYVSPFDATVVERLRAAGMVCLGKTNMDEFAMGSSNETSYFGPVKNPWDFAAVAGGSSGGSAAAVAAGLTPAATGSDTGGSIRQPAALCGISGIKPTYGLVSRYGMIAYASSLDQAGPMAHSAADCALLLNALVAHDKRDASSLIRPAEDYTRYLNLSVEAIDQNQPLKGMILGLPTEYFAEGLDASVRTCIEQAIAVFESLGAQIKTLSLPHSHYAPAVYYVLASSEAASNLARYDGVRYGHRSTHADNLMYLYGNSRAEGFGKVVKQRILIGTHARAQENYADYFLKAQKVRRLIAQDFQKVFAECDLILGPVTPDTAWPIGESIKEEMQIHLADIYTLSANLAGLPAMSIPCGFNQRIFDAHAKRHPIGLQLMGNYFNEARLLHAAHVFQSATDWLADFPVYSSLAL